MAGRKKKKTESILPLYRKLKRQRRSLGLLHYQYKDDRKFKKWETFTENIIIACFGKKSNQLDQFHKLINNFRKSDFSYSYQIDVNEFKPKMRDLLTNFIEELELGITPPKKRPSTIISPKIVVSPKQIVIQRIDISQTIETILNKIREQEPDEEKVKEAEKKLKTLEKEIKKDKPTWSVIKQVLIWLLNFSRDAFLQIFPILIEKYIKG